MISLKNILLKEYSDKVINNTIERWKKEKPDLDDNQAKAVIQRFEQVKQGLSSKLDIITLSDELRQSNNYLNIDKYSLVDMVALLRSIPEKEDKIKKEAAKKFSKEAGIPETTTRQYVARFFGNKDNLKFAAREGNDQFSKEEVLSFIPRNLQREEMFLDPRNWRWEKFEQMMDALFPYYGSAEDGEENFATTDADKVYDKDGIEIYKADDVNKCIAYNPVNQETNRKMYGWCVSQVGNTNYDYYRFEERSPTFYFVFDRNKTSEKQGSSFIDKWHAFVVQVNKNPKQDETYRVTSANNDSDTRAAKWEDIAKIVPPDTWSRIKELKDYFKPIDLSPVERGRKFASGKNLSLDEFKELSTDEKILYIQGKASKNSISRDILEILPKFKIPLEGRSTTLANVAIDSGQEFPYSILKDYESLAKRYAIYRYRHTEYANKPLPLSYIKYLDSDARWKYLNTFEDYTNFENIEKYFGEEILKRFVDKKVSELNIIYPEKYFKYIEDKNKLNLYKLLSKLNKNWSLGDNFTNDEEKIDNSGEAMEQNMTPQQIFASDISNFTSKDLENIIRLAKEFDGKDEYAYIIYSLPYILNNNGEELILLPENEEYQTWYAFNKNGQVKKKFSGESKLENDVFSNGYPNSDDMRRYYDISDFEEKNPNQINEQKKYSFLAEIKIDNPTLTFKELMSNGLYGNANRTIAVFKQMGFNKDNYGDGLEGFFNKLSQEDKKKMIGIAIKMNKSALQNEIKINKPKTLLDKTKELYLKLYNAPKSGFDGELQEEIYELFLDGEIWHEDESLVDLFDKLPQDELKDLYKYLIGHQNISQENDLEEIKLEKPNKFTDRGYLKQDIIKNFLINRYNVIEDDIDEFLEDIDYNYFNNPDISEDDIKNAFDEWKGMMYYEEEEDLEEIKINQPGVWGDLVPPSLIKPGDKLRDYNDDEVTLIKAVPWKDRNVVKKYDNGYTIDEFENNLELYNINSNSWLVAVKIERWGKETTLLYNYGEDGAYKKKENIQEKFMRERLQNRAGLR